MRLWVIVKVFFVAALVLFVGRELALAFNEVRWSEVGFTWPLAAAFPLMFAQRLVTTSTFVVILRGMGTTLEGKTAFGVMCVSSLGRYIPGRVMASGTATALLARRGVAVPIALAAIALTPALSMVVMLAMLAAVLLFHRAGGEHPSLWILAICLSLPGLAMLHPFVFIRTANFGLKLFGRKPVLRRITTRRYLMSIAMLILSVVLTTVSMYLIAEGVAAPKPADAPLFLKAVLIGHVGAFLVTIAPAGIGVTEAAYMLQLSPQYGAKAAIVVIIIRLFVTLADLLRGLVGWIIIRNKGGCHERNVEVAVNT